MRTRCIFMTLFFGVLYGVSSPSFAQFRTRIKPETVEAFNRYVEKAEANMAPRREGKKAFLSLYENRQNLERARKGEIIVERLNADQEEGIPGGIVHDWTGSMFIPHTTVDSVLHVLQDFNRHKSIYPEILDSRLLKQAGDTFRFYWRLKKEKVLTVVLNTEHEARYFQCGEGRWCGNSRSARIAEVVDPGTSHEQELPVGYDHGFLWRLYAYWFLEGTSEGVSVECRVISLTRDVPHGLGWVINPIISDLPRESLTATLEFTRRAVLSPR
jgi:hypothetical protein